MLWQIYSGKSTTVHWTTLQRHKSINCWVYLEMQPVSTTTTSVAMVLMHSPKAPYISTGYLCSTESISPTLEAVHLHCSIGFAVVDCDWYMRHTGGVDCRPYLGWKRRWQHFFLFLRITGGRALCNLIYSIFNNTPLIRYGFTFTCANILSPWRQSGQHRGKREEYCGSNNVVVVSL